MIINGSYALKVVNFLLGQQSGYTSVFFACGTEDRVNCYVKRDWPLPTNVAPRRASNMLAEPLFERENYFHPFAH